MTASAPPCRSFCLWRSLKDKRNGQVMSVPVFAGTENITVLNYFPPLPYDQNKIRYVLWSYIQISFMRVISFVDYIMDIFVRAACCFDIFFQVYSMATVSWCCCWTHRYILFLSSSCLWRNEINFTIIRTYVYFWKPRKTYFVKQVIFDVKLWRHGTLRQLLTTHSKMINRRKDVRLGLV